MAAFTEISGQQTQPCEVVCEAVALRAPDYGACSQAITPSRQTEGKTGHIEELKDTLTAKFTTHDIRKDFIRARRNNDCNRQGVHRTGVTSLMQLLTADMGIATTPVGAYLDPSTATVPGSRKNT